MKKEQFKTTNVSIKIEITLVSFLIHLFLKFKKFLVPQETFCAVLFKIVQMILCL